MSQLFWVFLIVITTCSWQRLNAPRAEGKLLCSFDTKLRAALTIIWFNYSVCLYVCFVVTRSRAAFVWTRKFLLRVRRNVIGECMCVCGHIYMRLSIIEINFYSATQCCHIYRTGGWLNRIFSVDSNLSTQEEKSAVRESSMLQTSESKCCKHLRVLQVPLSSLNTVEHRL